MFGVLSVTPDGAVYVASENGIYRIAGVGAVAELIYPSRLFKPHSIHRRAKPLLVEATPEAAAGQGKVSGAGHFASSDDVDHLITGHQGRIWVAVKPGSGGGRRVKVNIGPRRPSKKHPT